MDGADLMFVGAFVYLCVMFTMKIFRRKVKIFDKIVGFAERLEGKGSKNWGLNDNSIYIDRIHSYLPFNIHNSDK